MERLVTLASNRARQIPAGRSVAMAMWEADQCSKHFSYRLKGKTVTKRPVPMTWVKSFATSVSNSFGLSLRVRVRVQPKKLLNWQTGLSINPNCQLGYGFIKNS